MGIKTDKSMEKIINWAKEHKVTILIVAGVLIVAGLAYYFRDSFMPGIASDAKSDAPSPVVSSDTSTTPTPDKVLVSNRPWGNKKISSNKPDFKNLPISKSN